MPNRYTGNSKYKYGYNGKELDNEIKGQGNSYDFGARMLDPRVARFLSTDPNEYQFAFMGPYNYAANKPIAFSDFNGESPRYETVAKAYKSMLVDLGGTNAKIVTKNGISTVSVTMNIGGMKMIVEKKFTKGADFESEVSALREWGMDSYKARSIAHPSWTERWRYYGMYLDFLLDGSVPGHKPPLAIDIIARTVFAIPGAIITLSTGEDWMTGESTSTVDKGLAVTDLVPGLAAAKKLGALALVVKVGGKSVDLMQGMKYAGKLFECKNYAKEFGATIEKYLVAQGAKVTQKAYKSVSDWGIYYKGSAITKTGYHTFTEVVQNGKTYIFDNLNNGVLKEDFIKNLEIAVPNGNGGMKSVTGQEAYDLFTTGAVQQ